MRILRKIVYIVLAFSLICSFLQIDTLASIKNQRAIDIAIGLKMIDANMDTQNLVTRSEFIICVAKIMNIDASTLVDNNVFYKDVQPSDNAAKYINALTKMKILSGNDDRTFSPNEPIKYNDAIKILVSILGLDHIAQARGGYPVGYVSVAASKGISCGDSSNVDTITVSDLASLIVSTLETKLSESNPIDGVLESSDNETYMSKRLSLYRTDGIVTANGITALSGEKDNIKDTITVNDTLFYSDDNNENLLGKFVNVYYKYDDDKDQNTLLYAYVSETKNDALILKSDNINSFRNNSYYYVNDEFDEKEKKVNISTDFTLIYNGMALSDSTLFNNDLMLPRDGIVTLLDNDNCGEYDIVYITSYQTFMVSGYDRHSNTIYDKLSDDTINLDTVGLEYRIYNADGSKESIDNIAHEFAVLSVAKSLEGDYIEIIHSPKVIEGRIDEKNDEYYMISNGKYEISPNVSLELAITDEGSFYLDYQDKIVYFDKKSSTKDLFGYLISAVEKKGISDNISMKIYSEKNSIVILDSSSNIKIDGYYPKTVTDKLNSLKLNGDFKQLIKYRLNEDGKIYWVDSLVRGTSETDESLNLFPKTPLETSVVLNYYTYSKSLMGLIGVNPTTKIFVIPEPFDDEQILVTSPSAFYGASGKPVSISTKAYRENKTTMVSNVIVEKANFIRNATTQYYDNCNAVMASIVEDMKIVSNIDNESAYKLTLNYNGISTDVLTSSLEAIKFSNTGIYDAIDNTKNIYTVSKGDVVRYGADKYGKISPKNIIVLYDEDRRWFNSATPYYGTGHSGEHRVLRGWMYDKEQSWIRVTDNIFPTDPLFNLDTKTYIYPTNILNSVLVFNKITKKIRKGNLGDLKFYNNVGDSCSEFIFYSHYLGSNSMLVIYE